MRTLKDEHTCSPNHKQPPDTFATYLFCNRNSLIVVPIMSTVRAVPQLRACPSALYLIAQWIPTTRRKRAPNTRDRSLQSRQQPTSPPTMVHHCLLHEHPQPGIGHRRLLLNGQQPPSLNLPLKQRRTNCVKSSAISVAV